MSTQEQADSRLGLDAQQVDIAQAAARMGLRVRDSFVDVVSSGKPVEQRLQLMEAIHALQRGEVLLVARRDRLGRDVIEVAMVERLVRKRRARVVSAAGEGNGDEPADLLMRRLVDSFAEYERILIGARTKAALAVKTAHNERAGNLPYGSQLAADGVHLEASPTEQRIDRLMQSLAGTHQKFTQIAATLNANGYRTRNGTPWRREYVSRHLRKVVG